MAHTDGLAQGFQGKLLLSRHAKQKRLNHTPSLSTKFLFLLQLGSSTPSFIKNGGVAWLSGCQDLVLLVWRWEHQRQF